MLTIFVLGLVFFFFLRNKTLQIELKLLCPLAIPLSSPQPEVTAILNLVFLISMHIFII